MEDNVESNGAFDTTGTGAGALSAAGTPKRKADKDAVSTEQCPVNTCLEFRKLNGRFCHQHERHLAAMKYQAGQEGEEQLSKINLRMKDLAIACEELEVFGVNNVVLGDKTNTPSPSTGVSSMSGMASL